MSLDRHAGPGPLTRDLLRMPGRFGLGQVPVRLAPDATTRVVCGFCSTGCALNAHLVDGVAVNLSPDREYPVNLGMACPKGWEALGPLSAGDRLTHPRVRGADGTWATVSWERALGEMVDRFRSVAAASGPEAMAFLSTGQITTEEMVALGTLAKLGMGMVHGDGNTRQCMATSVVAYKESFGFDAPPYTYADFEESDVIVLVGSNLCIAHPILWERVCRNPHAPEIVVVDPRRTETAAAATQHYAARPGADLALFYAVANELIRRDAVDHGFVGAHTSDFEAFAAHVRAYTPASVSAAVGLAPSEIEQLARTIEEGRRVSLWWTMGVNQGHEAVRTAQALINIALLTGNIGRPGTGANSITGQCNAMGSRLFSNTTSLFGGRDFEDDDHRAEVASALRVDLDRIPAKRSLAYDQILERVREGKIKALWVIATNTAHSWIDQSDARELLGKLDVLVVQDLYGDTDTAKLADIVLPAAGWGEKEGTFINSERRIGITKKVCRAPGEALSDFHIFRLVAAYWGCDDLFARWETPEDVFESMQEMSRGRFCDITGIGGYAAIEEEGGIQWPLPTGEAKRPQPERRLFADGRFAHADGRARFCFEEPRALPEPVDEAFPLVLLTGRGSSSQWHTGTRTERVPVLRRLHRGECYAEIHSEDARRMGIVAEDRVRVASRRGELEARAVVRNTVPAGHVFVPMHYVETNRLTLRCFDPYSRQPAYKHCAVRVEAIDRG